MERKDVETKYTWDLSPIFPSDEAWEKEYKDFEKAFENSGLSIRENSATKRNFSDFSSCATPFPAASKSCIFMPA